MKGRIVLVPFPFDDLSSNKVRPAVCLTHEIDPYRHVVVAIITSRVSPTPAETDLVIDASDNEFSQTGLKVPSTVRLHRLMTVSRSIIKRELGELSESKRSDVDERLITLFSLGTK